MSRERTYESHSPIEVGADPTTKDVSRFCDLVVQVTGLSGIWDIRLEGSIDGTNWWPIETITANTIVHEITAPEIAVAWHELRLRTVTTGTGTPAGYVGGRILA